VRPPQGERGYTLKLKGVLAQAADAVQSQGALIAVLPEAPDPLPVFPVLWKEARRPAASAVLWKTAGRGLQADRSVTRGSHRFDIRSRPSGAEMLIGPEQEAGAWSRVEMPGQSRAGLDYRRAASALTGGHGEDFNRNTVGGYRL